MLTVKYLTPTEITKLFSKIKSERDKALFGMMYYYGLRCSEASRLTLKDLRIEDMRIFIQASKNGISGEYALSKEARKLILPYGVAPVLLRKYNIRNFNPHLSLF
jgi:integrase